MWEIKTEAPQGIRGGVKPIATRGPGTQICEGFPKIAARMDKCAVIRSVVGARGGQDAVQCLSGWAPVSMANMGGRPSMGATVSKVKGPIDPAVPPFVGLARRTQHVPWSDAGTPGFLGTACAPFKPDGPGMDDLTLKGTRLEQLTNRKKLLVSFDRLRRDVEDRKS